MRTALLILAGALLALTTPGQAALTLFSAWDLNEGTGTTITQAELGTGETWNQVTNPSATLSQTASQNISEVGGSWGSASSAPGSTSSLNFTATGGKNDLNTSISGAGLSGTGAKTFVAWINATGLDTNGSSILSYSPQGGGTNGADLRLLLDTDGDLRAEVSGGFFVNDSVGTGSDGLVGDGWTMVAAIFNGNTTTSSFYVGGVGLLSPTSTGARAIDTSGTEGSGDSEINIVMGGAQVEDRSFVGALDMVAVYEGAATLSELNSIYANGIAVPEPSSGLILLGGLAGLAWLRRRQSSDRM